MINFFKKLFGYRLPYSEKEVISYLNKNSTTQGKEIRTLKFFSEVNTNFWLVRIDEKLHYIVDDLSKPNLEQKGEVFIWQLLNKNNKLIRVPIDNSYKKGINIFKVVEGDFEVLYSTNLFNNNFEDEFIKLLTN